MAWFSRDKKAQPPDPQVATPAPDAVAPAGATAEPPWEHRAPLDTNGPRPAMGKYGPKVSITSFDTGPVELSWQLPLDGQLFAVLPGPDRPDYSVLVLERPLHFYPGETFDLGRLDEAQRTEDRRGRPMVQVHALLVCARFVGQQLHPGMSDLAVNVAYVIDNSLARDEMVDFAKIEYAAVGLISEGHREAAASDTQPESEVDDQSESESESEVEVDAHPEPDGQPDPEAAPVEPGEIGDDRPPEMIVMGEVCSEAASTLRAGIAEQRSAEVENLTVTLALDEAHRVTGLTGNADGQPPVPTPETFERLNAVLARLSELPVGHDVSQLTLTIEGDAFSSDVQYRS